MNACWQSMLKRMYYQKSVRIMLKGQERMIEIKSIKVQNIDVNEKLMFD